MRRGVTHVKQITDQIVVTCLWFSPCAAHARCLLMHTGALYLTSGQRQPIGACRLLRFYGLAVFLAAFLLTLFSVSVSHMTFHKWALRGVTESRTCSCPHVVRCSWSKLVARTGGW